MSMVEKNVRIYMQVGDKMFDISGDVSSFSITQNAITVSEIGDAIPHVIPTYMDAEFHVVGQGAWSLVDDFKLPKITSEWKCDFCGHINPVEARYCGHQDNHAVGCGARRSFLLDIQP
jgi:hypothetical protein